MDIWSWGLWESGDYPTELSPWEWSKGWWSNACNAGQETTDKNHFPEQTSQSHKKKNRIFM